MTELQAADLLVHVEAIRLLLSHGVRALYWLVGISFVFLFIQRSEI